MTHSLPYGNLICVTRQQLSLVAKNGKIICLRGNTLVGLAQGQLLDTLFPFYGLDCEAKKFWF